MADSKPFNEPWPITPPGSKRGQHNKSPDKRKSDNPDVSPGADLSRRITAGLRRLLEEDEVGRTDILQPYTEDKKSSDLTFSQRPQVSFQIQCWFKINGLEKSADGSAIHLGDGIFLTAGHNLRLHGDILKPRIDGVFESLGLYVWAGGGRRFDVLPDQIVIKSSFLGPSYARSHDIGMFRINDNGIGSPLSFGASAPFGRPVVVSGFPVGKGHQVLDGKLNTSSHPTDGLFRYKINTTPGMSGGAVCDQNGLIGCHIGASSLFGYGVHASQSVLDQLFEDLNKDLPIG